MIVKRQAAFIKYGKDSLVYKIWRNKVQSTIKTAKCSYYNNKVEGLVETNPKKWWKGVKSLTGQDTSKKQEWHHHKKQWDQMEYQISYQRNSHLN